MNVKYVKLQRIYFIRLVVKLYLKIGSSLITKTVLLIMMMMMMMMMIIIISSSIKSSTTP
jgi:hypothetical protein